MDTRLTIPRLLLLCLAIALLSAASGFGGGWLAATIHPTNFPNIEHAVAGCWSYTIPNRTTNLNTLCLDQKH